MAFMQELVALRGASTNPILAWLRAMNALRLFYLTTIILRVRTAPQAVRRRK